MVENVGKIINYVEGPFGKGTLKEAIICDFGKNYEGFARVVDYPIPKDGEGLNKRMIPLANMKKKDSLEEVKVIGEWAIKGDLTRSEKKFLKELLK